jgi:serine/threonine protein kinase
MPDLTGKSLGRYHIIEQLGEGGMAIVYKAYDTRLETDVAVKVIRTDNILPSVLDHALKRFEREAKLLARLLHPNIVKVIDYGEFEGMPYLVMPYLPGGTLKKKLGKPTSWQESFQLLLPIAEALDYAHSQNMIHRDVKPSNILLTQRGQPMMADFGIAKILDLENTQELTGTSMMIGTPEYMAPEQVTSKTVDHRADIYALGIVLYEMVTGRQPFLADTPMAVLLKHNSEPLPHPRQFVPNLPDEVEKVLLKALAKHPDNRYQSMDEFAAVMKKLLAEQPTQLIFPQPETNTTRDGLHLAAPTHQQPAQSPRQDSRWGMLGWGAVAGLFCFIAAAVLFLMFLRLRNSPERLAATLTSPAVTSTPVPLDTQTPILPSETPPPTSIPLPAQITDEKGVPMALIPAGSFLMGSLQERVEQDFANCEKDTNGQCELWWFTNETPQHLVTLDDYYIDLYEVTNSRYAECVAAGVCNAPSPTSSFTRDEYYGLAEFDDYPVIHVSWADGKVYCEWRGARLPTEAEWEKAARGTTGLIYPWGNEFDGTRVNFCDSNCPLDWANKDYNDYFGDTSPVGYYESGKSPYGVYDMAGNVWEWISDWYQEDYYSISPSLNPLGPETGQYRALRGGSWSNVSSSMHSSLRSWDVVPSLAQYGYYGFRCARSTTP